MDYTISEVQKINRCVMSKRFLLFLSTIFLLNSYYCKTFQNEKLEPYIKTLKEKGKEPVEFVIDKLNAYDLILFDDALHTAVEPFEFYTDLIKNSKFREKVKYIFLEAVSLNQQTALDRYFNSETEDLRLLYPAFQNDFSGLGWRYKTYFDFLQSIWKVNSQLPAKDRLRVIAVNAPAYWKDINTPRDLDLFRISLIGNDYTMYQIMLAYLNYFNSGKKGIFLTNTRHAYKHIKNKNNDYYLNCGTFFNIYNYGKTYSVRFHNVNLSFEGIKQIDAKTSKTTEGLEDKVIKWVRMEKGLWDSAFELNGNKPVAFDLKDTPFGKADYIGNHMLNAAANQTVYDAYDALIFLSPIENLHKSAMVDYIYTDEFLTELERRFKILYTDQQIEQILSESGKKSIKEYIAGQYCFEAQIIDPLVKEVGPIDEWKEISSLSKEN